MTTPFWAKGILLPVWMFVIGVLFGSWLVASVVERPSKSVMFYCDYNSHENGCVRYLPNEDPEDIMTKQIEADRKAKNRIDFSVNL